MQQIRYQHKQKRAGKPNSFVSVVSTWCANADVKITFGDDPEGDVQEIRELLDDAEEASK